MKKVLFVIPSLSGGGAERVVSEISSELSSTYEVYILIFYKSIEEYKVSKNVKIINLSNGEKKEYFQIGRLNRLRKIRKTIKDINPDAIIPFLSFVCIYCFISLLFTKYINRLIFTERCNPKFFSKKISFLKKICQIFIKKIIVQNSGQQSQLMLYEKRKSFIIPNPINKDYLEFDKKLPQTPTHIISIGRLTKQKNYELAINAFNNLLKDYPNMIYHIYGQGEENESISNLINDLCIHKNVILEGYCSCIENKYKNADIYLMTSKFEGLPNALAESMAVGIPSISTNCDFGPSDLIENEDMGILVKEGDQKEVENALRYMILNYQKYINLSKKTKEKMKQKYSIESIKNKWIEVIEK